MATVDHDVTNPDDIVIGTHMTGYYRNGRKYTHFVTGTRPTRYRCAPRQDKHAHPAPR